MIRCVCGKKVLQDDEPLSILKSRAVQINQAEGLMNIKCGQCKRWLERIPIGHLTGEIQEDLDFRNKIDL